MHKKIIIFLFLIGFIQAQEVSTIISRNGTVVRDGLSVAEDGTIYASNWGSNIHKVFANGNYELFATGFQVTSGNVIDKNGNLFVCDNRAGTVTKIYSDGTKEIYTSGIGGPIGIDFDSTGDTLYVAGVADGKIYKVLPNGSKILFSQVSTASYLTIDDNDNIYVCTFNGGRIYKLSSDGTPIELIQVPQKQISYIKYNKNRIYITARSENKIYYYSLLDSSLHWLAGSGIKGDADGSAETAQFNFPNGLAVSPDGSTVYVTDGPLMNLRKIDLGITNIEKSNSPLKTEYKLLQNYPNPFNPNTNISFYISKSTDLKLEIYNSIGKKIKTLTEGSYISGNHSFEWDGKNENNINVSSGIYYYTLKLLNENKSTKKMILIK